MPQLTIEISRRDRVEGTAPYPHTQRHRCAEFHRIEQKGHVVGTVTRHVRHGRLLRTGHYLFPLAPGGSDTQQGQSDHQELQVWESRNERKNECCDCRHQHRPRLVGHLVVNAPPKIAALVGGHVRVAARNDQAGGNRHHQ
jgi:hypothetical protein